jgi:hypothetical protein
MEGGYGSAALGGLIDGGIDEAEPTIEVSNGMGLDVDPRREGCLLGFHGRLGGATFPHMGGDKLGIDPGGVDHGETADQDNEGEPPGQRVEVNT